MANEMKTLTIGGNTFKVVDGDAVHCCEQALTEEQKAQARANIGAAAEGGGGAAAAPDPVVFTMSADTGETTCNKTYEECLERCASGNIDAELHMGMMGAVLGIMKSSSYVSGAMTGEDSVKYYFSSPSDGMMTALLVTVGPDGVEVEM